MPVLDRIGLGRKPPQGGLVAERHRFGWWAVRAGALLGLTALTVTAFPRVRTLDRTYEVGDAWRGETVVAPFTFAVGKDRGVLEAERRAVRFETPPFFRVEDDVGGRIRARRDTVAAQLAELGDLTARARAAARAGDAAGALRDSLRADALRRAALVAFPEGGWRDLVVPPAAGPLRASAAARVLGVAEQAVLAVAAAGALDRPRDSVATEVFLARSEADRTDRLRPVASVRGVDEALRVAEAQAAGPFADDPAAAALVPAVVRALFQPTYTYLAAETEAEWGRRARRVPSTLGEVREGEVVVERGQRLTPDLLRRVTSLEAARADRGGAEAAGREIGGEVVLAGTTFFLFFLYLYLLRRSIFDSNRHVVAVTLVFAGVIVCFGVAVRLASVEMLAVPVAIASILLTIVYDSRVGVFGTLTLALIGGHLLRYDLGYTYTTLFGCILVVFTVRDLRNRGQIFLSAALLFLAYATVLTGGVLVGHLTAERYTGDLVQAGLNAFLMLLTYPLVWLFERAFGITTDLTLLELSHPSRPLLRELQAKAPGTFAHSLHVASLADACADAVGADALLARVGALYHDVGKMRQPEYFVENQARGENPHDALTPPMSALVIASHVKDGVEIGRQYGLPEAVLRFIPRHHGTTRIEYFYRKALAARAEADPPVDETTYRYPGPRPDSKETAILMLCDSIEAAARSLDEPSPKRLEHLVDTLIEARRSDGQLDEAELTFKDLRRIRETLVVLLVGHYHGRIRYPGHTEPLAPEDGSDAPAVGPPEAALVPVPDARNEKVTGIIGDPERRAEG